MHARGLSSHPYFPFLHGGYHGSNFFAIMRAFCSMQHMGESFSNIYSVGSGENRFSC